MCIESSLKSPWDVRFFFFLGLFQFAAFIYYFPQSIILIPYGDALDWISNNYVALDKGSLSHLFTPHNKHIIVIPRLLLAIDVYFFDGRGYPVALIRLIFLLVATAIIVYKVYKHFGQPTTRLFLIGGLLILLFPTFRYTNYTSLPNCNASAVGFFSFISFVFISMSLRNVDKSAFFRIFCFSLSMIAAFSTSWSSLNGYLVWPILFFIVWRLKGGFQYAVLIFFFLILSLPPLSQSISDPLPPQEASIALFSFEWLSIVGRYLIELYGMPWSYVEALYWPACLIGVALFSISIFTLFYFSFLKRDDSPISLIALSVLVFSTLTILMIVIGRAHIIPDPAHRYGFYVSVSCVSIFLLWAPYLESRWAFFYSNNLLRYGALLLGIILVAQQIPIGRFAVDRAAHFHELDQIIINGDAYPEDMKLIYPVDEQIESHYKMLERHSIYSFRKK